MDLAFLDVISQHNSFQENYFNIVALLFIMTEKEPRTMRFIFHSKYSEYSDLNKSIFQSKPFKIIHNDMIKHIKNPKNMQQTDSIDLIMSDLFSLPIQLIQLRLDKVIKEPVTEQTHRVFKSIWNGLCDEYYANDSVRCTTDSKQFTLK